MQKHIQKVVWPGRKTGELVQGPKSRKHERVVHCPSAGPDFLKSQGANDAGILGEMRFVVPNEAVVQDARVCDENQDY